MNSLLYLSPLFLYFPRIPGGPETQPIITLLLMGFIFLTCKFSKQIPVLIAVGLMVLFLIPSLIQLVITYDFETSFSSFGVLLGPIFLFVLLSINAPPPSRKSLAFACLLLIGIAILEVFFSSIYETAASALLPRVTVFNSHRGLSLLTPEPTYASISLIYMIFLSLWTGRDNQKEYQWIEPSLFILALLTFSIYPIIFIITIFLIKYPKAVFSLILVLVLVLNCWSKFGGGEINSDNSIRAFVAIDSLLYVDYSNFLTSISTSDISLGARIVANYAGYLTPSVAPFGLGLSCSSLHNAMLLINDDVVYSNPLLLTIAENGCLKPSAYLANVILALGYFGILFLILIICSVRIICDRLPIKFYSAPFACALIILILQGQVSSPVPWFLIYFAFINPYSFTKKYAP